MSYIPPRGAPQYFLLSGSEHHLNEKDRLKPENTGFGRFLENIPAGEQLTPIPVHLVIDEQNGTLPARISGAIADAGGVGIPLLPLIVA